MWPTRVVNAGGSRFSTSPLAAIIGRDLQAAAGITTNMGAIHTTERGAIAEPSRRVFSAPHSTAIADVGRMAWRFPDAHAPRYAGSL